jgi:hypothetical protein
MVMYDDLLLVVDAYLSNKERSEACLNLINQLKEILPEYEILLINKSKESYGLEKQVDHYFNYGKSFLVGYPPEDIISNENYELPYVYAGNDQGVCENWLPLKGISDHVASVYNSFIIASNLTKMLGYNKLFRVEYDTIFDKDELLDIKKDLQKDWEYLFYGKRQEGKWAKPWHYLIDVHICGYSPDLFNGFTLVKNDDEYWKLCNKIDYFGKWIEYVISHVLEYQLKEKEIKGICYEGFWYDLFPKTQFDIISGSGGWIDKWKSMPKICKVSYDQGITEVTNEFTLFYWNDQESDLTIKTKIYDDDTLIHDFDITLKNNYTYIEKFPLEKELRIEKTNIIKGNIEEYTEYISPQTITQHNTRFMYK